MEKKKKKKKKQIEKKKKERNSDWGEKYSITVTVFHTLVPFPLLLYTAEIYIMLWSCANNARKYVHNNNRVFVFKYTFYVQGVGKYI